MSAAVGAPRRLVLAGAGHAHAEVLRGWARAPLPGVELCLVAPAALAPYSGLVPAWLAGRAAWDAICIDFAALAAAAGARWLPDALHAVDPDARRLVLASGATLAYDLLSLNVGSTLTPPPVPAHTTVLALRPLAGLHAAWEPLLARWQAGAWPGGGPGAPCRVTAVGGGAAGVECLLAVLARLRALQPGRHVEARLVAQSDALLPGMAPAAARAAGAALARAGVRLQLATAWDDTMAGDSDLLLWATGAEAHAWQRDIARRGTLAASEGGYVCIDATLRSRSHPEVFAVGDCAAWTDAPGPLPKAGVHAVRMGPVLAHNLRAALAGAPLHAHRPQRRFLVLLATADGRAIAARGSLVAEGRWALRWKDRIDRRFLRRYRAGAAAGARALPA